MYRLTKTFKRKPTILAALLVGGICGYGVGVYNHDITHTSAEAARIEVRFSPRGHCTQLVEETIAKAENTILVQAYSFTSLPIADALIAAHQRGVTVSILVDRSQLTSNHTQVHHVMQQGITVAVDRVPGIAHNKVMIIDDVYVLTGSFNWTQAAETRNAENLLLIKDPNINRIYKEEWNRRAVQAEAPK